MAGSISPIPSFHLCPDFNIAPPPHGHLQLGSILRGLDTNGVLSPLDYGATIPVPETQLQPRDKPQEKTGFRRNLQELRAMEGSIWAKIFSSTGPGFSFLRKRENDETLTIETVFVRSFHPTSEYMKNALEIDSVAFYIRDTKWKKPVYLITGLMWTEGASLSKIQSKKMAVAGQAGATDPNSGLGLGVGGSIEAGGGLSSGFDGSTPFILGIRVRKIWWNKERVRHDEINTVGSTLGPARKKRVDMLDDVYFVDDDADVAAENAVGESLVGEPGEITWILP